jgi:hypothetical protein
MADLMLRDILENVAAQIKQPISQDELEFLLIQNGLDYELKKGELKRQLGFVGVIKKLIMIKGIREYYWTTGNGQSQMSRKIEFYKFLESFLADKNEINARDLAQATRDNNFNPEYLQRLYFHDGGVERNWNGWKLVRRDGEKYYKKLENSVK